MSVETLRDIWQFHLVNHPEDVTPIPVDKMSEDQLRAKVITYYPGMLQTEYRPRQTEFTRDQLKAYWIQYLCTHPEAGSQSVDGMSDIQLEDVLLKVYTPSMSSLKPISQKKEEKEKKEKKEEVKKEVKKEEKEKKEAPPFKVEVGRRCTSAEYYGSSGEKEKEEKEVPLIVKTAPDIKVASNKEFETDKAQIQLILRTVISGDYRNARQLLSQIKLRSEMMWLGGYTLRDTTDQSKTFLNALKTNDPIAKLIATEISELL